MRLIWLTRGKTWGFRFLENGGYLDPLPVYDVAFQGLKDEREGWYRVPSTHDLPEMVALRFMDPDGRKDRAGRVIPHDFVMFSPDADKIDSLESGRRLVWDEVAPQYAQKWDADLNRTPGQDSRA